jgi:hypothetical protein
MSRDQDPLDALRHAWQSMPAPTPEDLLAADRDTERVVDWLRAAWIFLPEPTVVVPSRRPLALRTRAIPLLRAAAVLLIGATLIIFAFRMGSTSSPVGPTPEDEPPFSVPSPPPAVEVTDLRSDRIELRSGPVRLILVQPSGPSADPDQEPSP